MKRKKSKAKLLKDKCWKLFSQYIRMRYADKNGTVACVTCGKRAHWKEMQAGHYVSSRCNSVLFNEDIVHPQCAGCNLFKGGNYNEYTKYMHETYGYTFEQLYEFEKLKHVVKKFTVKDYEDMIEMYKSKIAEIEAKQQHDSTTR